MESLKSWISPMREFSSRSREVVFGDAHPKVKRSLHSVEGKKVEGGEGGWVGG